MTYFDISLQVVSLASAIARLATVEANRAIDRVFMSSCGDVEFGPVPSSGRREGSDDNRPPAETRPSGAIPLSSADLDYLGGGLAIAATGDDRADALRCQSERIVE